MDYDIYSFHYVIYIPTKEKKESKDPWLSCTFKIFIRTKSFEAKTNKRTKEDSGLIHFLMLSKSKRLSTEEFQYTIDKGHIFHSPFIIIRLTKAIKSNKFSISVPKKVTKTAVFRNKIRRQVFNIIKKLNIDLTQGFNAILIMKVGAEKLDFTELNEEIRKIFVKSGLLK